MALTNCPNCGHPISAKALECPNCHHSFSVESILEGKWGKYFLIFCILVFVDPIFVIVACLWNYGLFNFSLIKVLTNPLFYSYILTIYWVGVIGLTYILSMSCRSKGLRLTSFLLCVLAFAVREILFFEKIEIHPIYILPLSLCIIAFSIIAVNIVGPVKFAILLFIIPFVCRILKLFISFDTPIRMFFDFSDVFLQTISTIWLFYYAAKHVYRR